jgi:hypothetical protein
MISYEVFMKHAEKVTKNAPEVRTILSGVKHLENGNAVVTDSHRLYVAKGIHSRTDGAVLTPKGKPVDGNYPDVSRLIPDPLYAKQKVEMSVAELYNAADAIYSVGSFIEETPRLDFVEDSIRYDSPLVNYKRQVPVFFNESMYLNARYVLDAVKLLKAAGCQTITLNFYGSMRPFTLTNEDESLLALILPIRKY